MLPIFNQNNVYSKNYMVKNSTKFPHIDAKEGTIFKIVHKKIISKRENFH
jgi:hypothetical protein